MTRSIIGYAYNDAAWDWFTEQTENETLVINRGGRVGEPLPAFLGLFDKHGLPHQQQHRAHFVALQAWADVDDNWLEWVFPEGLSPEDENSLLADLAELKTHDWSPYGFMQAVLDDWPKSEPVRDWSLETREREMQAACQAYIDKSKAPTE